MAQRVTLEQATRLTGRTGKTLRSWLTEEPPVLSVIPGHHRGGVRTKGGKVVKGQTRLLDVDELEALNAARGGTWHPEHLPPPSIDDLVAEVAALKARVAALEAGRTHRETWLPPRLSVASDGATGLKVPEVPEYVPEYVPPVRIRHRTDTRPLAEPYVPPHQRLDPSRYKKSKRKPKPPLPIGWVELPPGWIAVTTFSENHGLIARSVKRQPHVGNIRLPLPVEAPEGEPWGNYSEESNHWYPVQVCYTADQLPEVLALCRQIWPQRWRQCDDPLCPCQELEP